MRALVLGLAGLVSVAAVASAAAGECYRRVVDPAQYRTVTEQVLVSPERVVADYVPAVVREVAETVVVEPEREVVRVIAAQYNYEDETVLVSPAHREWQVRDHYGERIGCWVTAPASYARQSRRVLVSPARQVYQTIPAVTETRVHQVVVEPAHNYARVIPAQYAVRERAELVSSGGARWAPASDLCEH